MLWINLIALLCVIAGFASGWQAIRRRRLPARVEATLVRWQEDPPPAFHYDRLGILAISAHAVAVLTLSILLVGSVNRSAASPFSLEFLTPTNRWLESSFGIVDAQSRWLSFIIGALAAGIGAFTLGGELSFPVVRLAARPVLIQCSAEGIFHGSVGIRWEHIAMWSIENKRRLLELYSDGSRPTLLIILRPPGERELQAAIDLLRQEAPDAEVPWPSAITPGRVRRFAFILLGSAALVLTAFLLSPIVAEWVWFVYGVELLALGTLGVLLAKT